MAALTLSKSKKASGKGRSMLPVKRSINLAGAGEKPLNMKLGVPAIILILVAAAAFGKFGVADRLTALSQAQREVESLRTQLTSAYNKLDQYSELEEKYAHYTYSGMTSEELSRVDRTEAVRMIERVVIPQARLSGWSVSGNQLNLTVSARTLQEINLMAQQIENEDIVDYCQVLNAATDTSYVYYEEIDEPEPDPDSDEEPEAIEPGVYYGVSAQVSVYLIAAAELGG